MSRSSFTYNPHTMSGFQVVGQWFTITSANHVFIGHAESNMGIGLVLAWGVAPTKPGSERPFTVGPKDGPQVSGIAFGTAAAKTTSMKNEKKVLDEALKLFRKSPSAPNYAALETAMMAYQARYHVDAAPSPERRQERVLEADRRYDAAFRAVRRVQGVA